MKKTIKIKKLPGELENGQAGTYIFTDGELEKIIDPYEETVFRVCITVLQAETNTSLRTIKEFENSEAALNFLKLFTRKNPVSEAILEKRSVKQLYHYV